MAHAPSRAWRYFFFAGVFFGDAFFGGAFGGGFAEDFAALGLGSALAGALAGCVAWGFVPAGLVVGFSGALGPNLRGIR